MLTTIMLLVLALIVGVLVGCVGIGGVRVVPTRFVSKQKRAGQIIQWVSSDQPYAKNDRF